MRLLSALVCGAALSLGAAAHAAPLTFGALGEPRDLSDDPQLAACRPVAAGSADRMCTLRRTTFGGLPIQQSDVRLNGAGHASMMTILLRRSDYDTASRMLAGRYGGAQSVGDSTRWSGYDGGGTIALQPRGRFAAITFAFADSAQARRPGVVEARALPALLAGLVGLLAGWLVYRSRSRAVPKREPIRPEAPLSMRDTLERRVRQGGSFHL